MTWVCSLLAEATAIPNMNRSKSQTRHGYIVNHTTVRARSVASRKMTRSFVFMATLRASFGVGPNRSVMAPAFAYSRSQIALACFAIHLGS